MSARRGRRGLNLGIAARVIAGCVVLAVASFSATAQAAPPGPSSVFTATMSLLSTGGAAPYALAIGDLHSTSTARAAANAARCHPTFDSTALDGCRNDLAATELDGAVAHLNSRHGANDIAVANSFGYGVTLFTNTTP